MTPSVNYDLNRKSISKNCLRANSALSPTTHSAIIPITLGVSIGCLISAIIPAPLSLTMLLSLCAILALPMALPYWKRIPTTRLFVSRLITLLIALLIGWQWHNPRLPNSALPRQSDNTMWIVEIASLPKRTANNYRYQINTLLVFTDSQPQHWKTSAQLYLNALDSSASTYLPGDLMLLTAAIRPLESSDSASIFDYPTWAKTHGIAGSVFASELSLLPLNASNLSLRNRALRMHRDIIKKMQAVGISQPEIGPIAAMTFGERSELSADINRHFRSSGLAHILAISGFHVGIIFWFFQLFARLITIRSYVTALLRQLSPIIAIWLYATFCGLAPPIVRAATIVTAYGCALALQVRISQLEAFLISLAVVLLSQPTAPYDIGFYLSFLAVAGIVTFMPFFNTAINVKSRKVKKFTELFLVSVAAQLATTPLVLLAFRSLPIVGIIASAPASLLSFPILIGGLLIALLPKASIAARIVAYPLKWAGRGLVLTSQTASALTPPALANISLPLPAITLLFIAIIAFALFARYRQKQYLIATFAILIAAIITCWLA